MVKNKVYGQIEDCGRCAAAVNTSEKRGCSTDDRRIMSFVFHHLKCNSRQSARLRKAARMWTARVIQGAFLSWLTMAKRQRCHQLQARFQFLIGVVFAVRVVFENVKTCFCSTAFVAAVQIFVLENKNCKQINQLHALQGLYCLPIGF